MKFLRPFGKWSVTLPGMVRNDSGNGTEGFPEWYGTILHPRREASEDTNLIYYAVL